MVKEIHGKLRLDASAILMPHERNIGKATIKN